MPTQEMLGEFLADRGFSVVRLNGSMDMEERRRVQEEFDGEARILVSIDAGGEGLNLQFCHVVVNYDIPWNPMRLEQRIGRVDRIGQTHEVQALNLVLENSVEHRVREVLEEKLAVIVEEFGVDKTGDVLDSADAERWFDDVFVEAILHPDRVEDSVEELVSRVKEEAGNAKDSVSVLGESQPLDPNEAQRLLVRPLPHWVERMTTEYVESRGGRSEKKGGVWCLEWPERRILPLFVHDDGRVLGPTARNIWDQLISTVPGVGVANRGADAIAAYEQAREKAEEHGRGLYRDVLLALKQRVEREEERGNYAFAARRRAIERVGLPEVRSASSPIVRPSLGDKKDRFSRLTGVVSDSVPDEEARHDDWMKFAQRWGELTALALELGASIPREDA